MARPPKAQLAIDKDELKKLMKLYPSRKEAADWFEVSESSLERFIKKNFKCSFDALRDKSFAKTKIALKRAQIDKALKGDNTMMIWCGKQWLGQREPQYQDPIQNAKIDKSEQAARLIAQFTEMVKDQQCLPTTSSSPQSVPVSPLGLVGACSGPKS